MPDVFTLCINCIAFIIFTKHFTFILSNGGLSLDKIRPKGPYKIRPSTNSQKFMLVHFAVHWCLQ